MIDTQSAAQQAVYDALNGSDAVIALADVWQNPPENTQPGARGLVILGLVSVTNEGAKGDDLDRISIPIFTQMRKADATALYALNSAVRNALEAVTLAAPGAEIDQIVFVSADPHLMPDGQTYEDELRFEMYVQAA